MPKTSEMFSGSYLKASDIGRSRAGVVIEDVVQEQLGKDEKWVLRFKGKEKGLVLNKTNASILEEVLGSDDTDDWVGKRITLYSTKVEFQGKRVDAIRVSDDPRDYPKREKAKSEPKDETAAPEFQADDDDVPF